MSVVCGIMAFLHAVLPQIVSIKHHQNSVAISIDFPIQACPDVQRVQVADAFLMDKAQPHWEASHIAITAAREDPQQRSRFTEWLVNGFGAYDPELAARAQIASM